MSKAFTKEDDDSGFTPPLPSALLSANPSGHFRITYAGAQLASFAHAKDDERARAEILPRVINPQRGAMGVTVVVRLGEHDEQRSYRLVSPEERAFLGDGCSIDGPIGSVLVGAEVGDVREVTLPRGIEELEVIALEGE